MFATFWHIFLYQPLFNVLIWIYANIANFNLGWAVVWLTVFLRVILLPLTIISELNTSKRKKAEDEAFAKAKAFKGDAVARKEEIRRVMKKYHISPWAKVVTLGIQLLVLILLYQVFIGGIIGEKMYKNLYPSIDFPGKVNVDFYGFDIGKKHDAFWAGVVALYLFVFIFWTERKQPPTPKRAAFLVLFPAFTFIALWVLPMVKSLFILTSMLFSDIIGVLIALFTPKKKAG